MGRSWRTFLWALLLAGCGGGDSGDDDAADVSAPGAGTERAYSNGHPLSTPTSDAALLSVEEELLALTNNHRVALGLSALIHEISVRDVARAHAKHMVVHDFFDHANPEGDSPGGRLTRAGISWRAVGENIAAGQASAQEAFQAWLASTGHRANIENTAWTHMGNGAWNDPSDGGALVYRRYFVQVFLRN